MNSGLFGLCELALPRPLLQLKSPCFKDTLFLQHRWLFRGLRLDSPPILRAGHGAHLLHLANSSFSLTFWTNATSFKGIHWESPELISDICLCLCICVCVCLFNVYFFLADYDSQGQAASFFCSISYAQHWVHRKWDLLEVMPLIFPVHHVLHTQWFRVLENSQPALLLPNFLFCSPTPVSLCP